MKKAPKFMNILFKIIIILWLFNIALYFFDGGLKIYINIVIHFYDGIYNVFYARVLRYIFFLIGWLAIIITCIKNRKKTFKGYNLLIMMLIVISIFCMGTGINYYRDYLDVQNDRYFTDKIKAENIKAIGIKGQNLVHYIKTESGDIIYLNSYYNDKISCLLKIQDLDKKIVNPDSEDEISIVYLKNSKSILKVEG